MALEEGEGIFWKPSNEESLTTVVVSCNTCNVGMINIVPVQEGFFTNK